MHHNKMLMNNTMFHDQYAKQLPPLGSKPCTLQTTKFNNPNPIHRTITTTQQQQKQGSISDMKERHCDLKLHRDHHNHHHHHHRRHHIEKVELKTRTSSYELEMKNNTCSLCRKTFSSNKALCGHMRCHPEREWRGIRPPGKSSYSAASTVSVDSKLQDNGIDSSPDIFSSTTTDTTSPKASNLLKLLPNWSSTARRGRKSLTSIRKEERTPTSIIVHGPPVKPEEASHADSPLHLSPSLSRLTDHDVPEKLNNSDSSVTKKRKIDDESNVVHEDWQSIGSPPKKMKACDERGLSNSEGDEFDLKQVNQQISRQDKETEHTQDYTGWGSFISLGSIHNNQKGPRLVELVGGKSMGVMDCKQKPLVGDKRFKCKTCSKYFPSHQALGGHTSSSHTKVHKSDVVDPQAQAIHVDEGIVSNSRATLGVCLSSKSRKAHQCNLCPQSFPTGQALGGHKRLHYVRQPAKNPTSVASLSSSPSQEEVNCRTGNGKLWNFNLNELAPEMEDEDLCIREPLVPRPTCSTTSKAPSPTLGSLHIVEASKGLS